MKYIQNLHTHGTFCDGKDTPEEMVLEAIARGFDAIGFSEHSPMADLKLRITLRDLELYKAEIARLKKVYQDQIKIYLGLEADMLSGYSFDGFDYLIGSVHYLKSEIGIVDFDLRSADAVRLLIEKHYHGDGMLFAKEYYRHLAMLPEYGKFDIIGHFDLITKHLEHAKLFDTDVKEYRFAAIEAAEALSGKIPYFEVNTGAIARGYRATPYPAPFLLKELKRLGFGAVITSDCHDKNFLSCHFEEARELLREAGFTERYYLTEKGFVPVEI